LNLDMHMCLINEEGGSKSVSLQNQKQNLFSEVF